MKNARTRRRSPGLSVSHFLILPASTPLIKALLLLAEALAEGGAIRNPLEFYQELANSLSGWSGFGHGDAGPVTRFYPLHSTAVKRRAAAVALCPDGIRTRDGAAVQILLLIAAPPEGAPSAVELEGHLARLLGPESHRDVLLRSTTPASARAAFVQLESKIESDRPPGMRRPAGRTARS